VTPLWFRSALLTHGWAEGVRLGIENGRIAEIATGVAPPHGAAGHTVAIAGMPNVHSHAFQRAMAGLTEVAGPAADNFWTWREAMYRFVDRLGPEDLEAITAFAYAEMLEGGYTRVAEFHYLHHDQRGVPYADAGELASRIAAAAAQAGIGLTLLPVLYAHGNFGGAPPGTGQRRFLNDIERFQRVLDSSRRAIRGLDGAIVGVAPHSLRAVTPAELEAVIVLAGDGPIHIHIAEQVREVQDCLTWSGRRPVEWLLEHAPVGERWCLVHATHVTDEEVRRAAATGAVAGLCPLTEANLGDGVFPAGAYVAAAGAYGIGSDSNILLDVAAELRTLEYAQRLTHRRRNVLAGVGRQSTGRTLLEAALAGGGRALASGPAALTVGADADIVGLDADHPSLAARRGDALLDSWIFASRDPVIDAVWRRGEQLVESGRHVRHEAIAARYREVLTRILA
jgi:formiminoglutamate deiminase